MVAGTGTTGTVEAIQILPRWVFIIKTWFSSSTILLLDFPSSSMRMTTRGTGTDGTKKKKSDFWQRRFRRSSEETSWKKCWRQPQPRAILCQPCPVDPRSTAKAGSTFETRLHRPPWEKWLSATVWATNDSYTQVQPLATNDNQWQPMATNGNQYDSSTQVHPLNPTVHFLYRSTRQPFHVDAQTQCPMLWWNTKQIFQSVKFQRLLV